jgi:hypothetical protein
MRRSRELTIAAACIVFCGWFLMKFHMDNANDSETQAYVGGLLASVERMSLSVDARGQYTALAPYVMWPFTATLQLVTGAYLIRGLVFSLVVLGVMLHAAAYAWYRRLGLGWLTSLVGLVVLSTGAAFALEIRGWEIDKLIEPTLFLLAALAAWDGRWVLFVGLAALAAANHQTGLFVPLLALAAPDTGQSSPPRLAGPERRSWRGQLGRRLRTGWAVWVSLAVCLAEVVWWSRLAGAPTVTPWLDLVPEKLGSVLGGFCLVPLLALGSWRAAPPGLRWLLCLTPVWVLFVLGTDRLEQGAVLLAPLALVWLPLSLLGVEQLIRAPTMLEPEGAAPAPGAPAGR